MALGDEGYVEQLNCWCIGKYRCAVCNKEWIGRCSDFYCCPGCGIKIIKFVDPKPKKEKG